MSLLDYTETGGIFWKAERDSVPCLQNKVAQSVLVDTSTFLEEVGVPTAAEQFRVHTWWPAVGFANRNLPSLNCWSIGRSLAALRPHHTLNHQTDFIRDAVKVFEVIVILIFNGHGEHLSKDFSKVEYIPYQQTDTVNIKDLIRSQAPWYTYTFGFGPCVGFGAAEAIHSHSVLPFRLYQIEQLKSEYARESFPETTRRNWVHN